uniref:Uncharacterized protein n=1 Tax=Arundo donax TaxID=35708 RepID=A0A0A9CE12_ARUDO
MFTDSVDGVTGTGGESIHAAVVNLLVALAFIIFLLVMIRRSCEPKTWPCPTRASSSCIFIWPVVATRAGALGEAEHFFNGSSGMASMDGLVAEATRFMLVSSMVRAVELVLYAEVIELVHYIVGPVRQVPQLLQHLRQCRVLDL